MKVGEISIGLLWHSVASGNLGVGALTVGNLSSARAVAEERGLTPRFTVLQPSGDHSRGANIIGDDIEVFDITGRSMASPSGYAKRLPQLDCILDIGAGDSFADIYGWKRYAYLTSTKWLAYLRGVPLLFSPQTIGPFTRAPYRALAARSMSLAEAVVVRDPESFEAARNIAPRARVVQSVDVAFRLPYQRPDRGDRTIAKVGVNVSGLLFNGGYSGRNEFDLSVDYPRLMREFIGTLSRRSDVRVHLICHVNTASMPADDDGRVADILAREYPSVVRAPDFGSPSEAKSYISGMDFLVAGRMHACIAAYSAGVPVVPIAYSRKFSGLFGGVLNYPHQVPVSGLSTEAALSFLLDRFAARDELARDIARGSDVVQAGLDAYDAELRRLFQRVARPHSKDI